MQEDPKGYYKILNVSTSATDDEIKIAYRNLAKRLHPDLNPGVDTTAIFQKVNEAYSVLSDPIQRAKYSKRVDNNQSQPNNSGHQKEYTKQKESVLEPYRCSACNCVSHKLRHIKYNQVISFIFASNTTTIWGIFCEQCAAARIRKASLITGAFGWMSVPGLFHTAFALGRNLTGGRQENSINMEICARQALYYHQLGDKEKAVSAAFDSIEFANSIFWSSEAKQRAEDLKPLLDSIIKSNASREDNHSYANSYSKSEPSESKNNQNRTHQNSEPDNKQDSNSSEPVITGGHFALAVLFIILMMSYFIFTAETKINKQNGLNNAPSSSFEPMFKNQRVVSDSIENQKIDCRHIFSPNGICIKCRVKEESMQKTRSSTMNDAIVEQSNIKESEIQKTINNETSTFRVKITNSPILAKKDLVTNTIETKTNAVKTAVDSNRGFNFNKTEHRGPTLRKLKQNDK
jgi:curved DNA-binding protein CbpA